MPTAVFIYNNSINYTLRILLFKAIYSYNLEFYIDIADNTLKGEILVARDYIKKLYKLRAILKEQLLKV